MRAILITNGGGPEVLKMGIVEKPQPRGGSVLIRVKAFGINQVEATVRRNYNPTDSSPRILGVEAVGEVAADSPETGLIKGNIVATALGCLQDQTWGSYAEYILVPASQVISIISSLNWATLGAMPLLFQAAHSSLQAFDIKSGQTLLIRGGTTALGLAVTAMASYYGIRVTGTTRNVHHSPWMANFGAKAWILDLGSLAAGIPQKYDGVLDLVGMTTLQDSLCCVKEHGIVCLAGEVGGPMIMNSFNMMSYLPNKVKLMACHGSVDQFMKTPWQRLVDLVQANSIPVPLARVFRFEEIVEAHRYLEQNLGMGRVVVTL